MRPPPMSPRINEVRKGVTWRVLDFSINCLRVITNGLSGDSFVDPDGGGVYVDESGDGTNCAL